MACRTAINKIKGGGGEERASWLLPALVWPSQERRGGGSTHPRKRSSSWKCPHPGWVAQNILSSARSPCLPLSHPDTSLPPLPSPSPKAAPPKSPLCSRLLSIPLQLLLSPSRLCLGPKSGGRGGDHWGSTLCRKSSDPPPLPLSPPSPLSPLLQPHPWWGVGSGSRCPGPAASPYLFLSGLVQKVAGMSDARTQLLRLLGASWESVGQARERLAGAGFCWQPPPTRPCERMRWEGA